MNFQNPCNLQHYDNYVTDNFMSSHMITKVLQKMHNSLPIAFGTNHQKKLQKFPNPVKEIL